jgi:hypothetical protein
MDNLANKHNPLTLSSIIFSDRIRSRECERRRFRLKIFTIIEKYEIKVRVKFSSYKLTNEIEFHEAFAKFKDSFKATILCVCRTLQREEVNEEV